MLPFRDWLIARGLGALAGALTTPQGRRVMAKLWDAESQPDGFEVVLGHYIYRARRVPSWPSGEPTLTWNLVGTTSFVPSTSVQLWHERGELSLYRAGGGDDGGEADGDGEAGSGDQAAEEGASSPAT